MLPAYRARASWRIGRGTAAMVLGLFVFGGCDGPAGEGAPLSVDDPRFVQGALLFTGDPDAFALEGLGLLAVGGSDGVRYVRGGTFRPGTDGVLTDAHGSRLMGWPVQASPHAWPQDLSPVRIDGDPEAVELHHYGMLGVRRPSGALEHVARVPVVWFPNPHALIQIAEGLFLAPDAAGLPQFGVPGDKRWAYLHQGMLEQLEHTMAR